MPIYTKSEIKCAILGFSSKYLVKLIYNDALKKTIKITTHDFCHLQYPFKLFYINKSARKYLQQS